MSKKLKYQLLAVVGVIIVAGLGSVFVNLGMDWFNGLDKPSQWIPNFLIPIVWTIVYILSAIILWILIKNDNMSIFLSILFVTNGVFNILWCLIFFTLHLTLLGNIVIIINLILGWILIIELFKYRSILYNLLIIYPVWLSIATSLNLCLWILN